MGNCRDFITGGIAGGDDFFFRHNYIENLWESLHKEHVLMLAPRRMGKTSVMLRLQDCPRGGRLVVYLNVEDLSTPAEFCQTLIVAIHRRDPGYFEKVFGTIWSKLRDIGQKIWEIVGKDIKDLEVGDIKIILQKWEPDWETNWKAKAEDLIAALRQEKKPLLIILDELPDMILNIQKNSPEKLGTFLHWFRAVRQNPEHDTIRWLVGGSVNLTSTLDRQGNLKLINDLRVESLPPFTAAEVQEFVETMLHERGVPFKPEIVDCIRELLGKPIPFFLQLLTQELYRDWRAHHNELTPEHVKNVFACALLGEAARDKLMHYRSRIRLHYPESECEAAYELLDLLSRCDRPLPKDALFTAFRQIEEKKTQSRTGWQLKQAFDDLLLLLQNDFYVEAVEDHEYDFASRILKHWWRKNCG